MEVKLTIDRGNTAIKAALWDVDGAIIRAAKGDASLPAGDLAMQLCHEAGLAQRQLAAIAYCSVVASDRADDLASLSDLTPRLVDLNATTPMPLTIAYRTPSTLGADRIAAALGALHIAGDDRPLLVSDIGTAVTYDYIAPGRIYVGGNIAPGIDLRLRALAAFTDTLPAVSADGDIPQWGATTAEAMRSGAVRGLAAELETYHHAAGEHTLAVLTGGSAQLLIDRKIITFDYIHAPYLVHQGLFSIIKK